MEAKVLLKQKQYDLMILDIALPERADQVPAPEAGIALLQEVIDRDKQYYRPREIVGLTAFSNIREQAAKRFAEDLWSVIQYDPGSDLG